VPTRTPTDDLDALRRRLGGPQRAFADALWAFYREHNQWVPARIVHRHFGAAAGQKRLKELGPSLARVEREDGKPYYRLTFLGVLLTGQGVEAESLLVRYLEYVRDRYRSDPRVEWVGSQDVEAALRLSTDQSRLLRQLVRLSHWWGGGSAFREREWTVGVPVDVDELGAEADVRGYVQRHVLAHFPVQVSRAGTAAPGAEPRGGAFWFIGDAALRERLTADWHEAQDVCHVRAWKSCVILCGGILEALLSRALVGRRAAALRGRPLLATLLAAAARRRLVRRDSVRLPQTVLAFRALTQPGRLPGAAVPGRAAAEAAIEAVRSCLGQLAAARRPPSPPAVR
jgi:hypothetical protein